MRWKGESSGREVYRVEGKYEYPDINVMRSKAPSPGGIINGDDGVWGHENSAIVDGLQ